MFRDNSNIKCADDLLRIIESNCNKAASLRQNIRKLKVVPTRNSENLKAEEKNTCNSSNDIIEINDESFEDFDYYLNLFKSLKPNFTKKDLLDILPDRDDFRFKAVIIRLQAETVKEMKEINEFINEERDDFSLEEVIGLQEELMQEARKRDSLKELLLMEKTEDDSENITLKNKIILVPTIAGNIKLIDEITSMPTEYYSSFLELINSIIDGSFKNFKRFVSNDCLVGMSEVRGFKTRIIFSRIGKDSYALVSAIIKKADNSLGYRERLSTRVGEYKIIEKALKEKLNDEEFMRENDFYVQELFNILENKNKSKKYKKYKRNGLND